MATEYCCGVVVQVANAGKEVKVPWIGFELCNHRSSLVVGHSFQMIRTRRLGYGGCGLVRLLRYLVVR